MTLSAGTRLGSGQTDPGISADFDYPQMWLRNSYGKLFLDRLHRFRLDTSYTTPFNLFIGLQGFIQSGAPLDKVGYLNQNYGPAVYLVPRGEARKLPTLWRPTSRSAIRSRWAH
jgi:hypothetical protein